MTVYRIDGYAPEPSSTLVLRTSRLDGTSRNGFDWPKVGPVFDPRSLYGYAWGHLSNGKTWTPARDHDYQWPDGLWQVVEVAASCLDFAPRGKVIFRRGLVVLTGDELAARDLLADWSRLLPSSPHFVLPLRVGVAS